MDLVSRALREDIPLPISLLSDLGKGSLRKYLSEVTPGQNVSEILSLWPKLVATACNPQVNNKHITAASNAVCVYLTLGATSTVEELRQFALSHEVWFQTLQCAHKAFNDGKNKPALQIMETLCDLIQRMSDPRVVTKILEHAAQPLVRIVLLASPRTELKKAALMLSYLYRRTSLPQHLHGVVLACVTADEYLWRLRLSEHHISFSDVMALGEGSIVHLFLALAFAMVDIDTRSSALKLCSMLCNYSADNVPNLHLQRMADRVFELYLDKNHTLMGNFAENVLPVILDSREKLLSFAQIYAVSCWESPSKMALFIAVLKVGRTKACFPESELIDIFNAAFSRSPSANNQSDKLYWCEQMLKTANSEIQILTYGLLISSHSTNSVVAPEVLDCVASSMKYLHDNADAHERSEILSLTRRLLRRLERTSTILRRQAYVTDANNEANIMLESYNSFIRSLYSFLKSELNTGISYPRHILSLTSLRYLFDSVTHPDVFAGDGQLVNALAGLILDPFEDVRGSAAALLQLLIAKENSLVASGLSHAILQRTEMLALRTGRADHADALGRLSALRSLCNTSSSVIVSCVGERALLQEISHLEQLTSVQGGIKLKPGCPIPIHGLLRAVVYRLQHLNGQGDQTHSYESTLLRVCVNVWEQVKAQLCVDSPETASEVDDDVNDEGPKDLLAYSWRALRDSSVVLQSLLAIMKPTPTLCRDIGDLCMTQLISLRHRGAFSTVAQTFNQCCDKVRTSADPAVHDLVCQWYLVVLTQIDEQADRLTRRSAGLPAAITALLSPADPNFFSVAVADLIAIAERRANRDRLSEKEETKLPQVHALNCLKEMTTNSKFSTLIVRHLDSVMELAAACLSSKTWAIRNCGLMLLRACINRLDTSDAGPMPGSQRSSEKEEDAAANRIATRLLTEAQLDTEELSAATEHVFAGLDLLSHAASKRVQNPLVKRLVLQHLSNSTWTVRDHAATVLASHIFVGNPIEAIHSLLESGFKGIENQIHGTLLCCRYLLPRATRIMTEKELESIIEALISGMVSIDSDHSQHSPYVYAAWFDLMNEASSIILQTGWKSASIESQYASLGGETIADINPMCNPHLLQRILLHGTYRLLLRESKSVDSDQQTRALIKAFIDHPDALRFTLDVLSQKPCHRHLDVLLAFLTQLISQAYGRATFPLDVLGDTFTSLTQCLEGGADMPTDTLQTFLHIDFKQLNTSREIRNTAAKLQASLLGRADFVQSTATYDHQKEEWLCVIRDASLDFLDFPTRMSAAESVSIYVGCVRDTFRKQSLKFRLGVSLILYNLLNDDDEEVRDEASQAVRKLRLHKIDAMDNLPYCALAAREVLLRYLEDQFKGTPEFAEVILFNIMRVGHNSVTLSLHAGSQDLLKLSVTSRLNTIAKATSDLFAEERQNLYSDDMNEIHVWTQAFHRGEYPSLAPESSKALIDWTLDGLVQVTELLETDTQKILTFQETENASAGERSSLAGRASESLREPLCGYPLGVTYDHEILVVIMQVVSLAGVLCRYERSSVRERLQGKLKHLNDICVKSPVNPVVLGEVERARHEQ